MPTILLIEDEITLVNLIRKGLSEEGFEISVALDGVTGQQMALQNKYDMVLLDIMLPDKNGLEVCRELRQQGNQTPILFLTALNTSDNIAVGLNSGADDYLVKPFKFNELIARINAVLRRAHVQSGAIKQEEHVYKVGDLVVNDDSKSVHRNGDLISLTATEYRLLMTLIKNRGRVLSRMDLLGSAWDINFNLGTNVVDVYINYLRKKIDAPYEQKLIHTVVGMGYILKEP